MAPAQEVSLQIPPVEAPIQFPDRQISFIVEVDKFLWVSQARAAFGVSGKGKTVAVLDSGINPEHVDFANRIVAQRNYTPDNKGDENYAKDGNGHGTNVSGIIAAKGDHIGIAPDANIVAIKVLDNTGSGSFAWVEQALQWIIDNQETLAISVICMSFGDTQNYTNDNLSADFQNRIRDQIRTLRQAKVAVVISAGNEFFRKSSQQGMGFPAIVRECISVGAVYDADEGGFQYTSGAIAYSSRAGQITPFSQRLHSSVNADTHTRIFAPGAPVTSSGIQGPHGESIQHGTSQAAPVVAGLVLLLQEFYQNVTGELPSVDDLITWLQRGGVTIHDGDDEHDNVQHTKLDFLRTDALSALDAARRDLQKRALETALAAA